MTLRNSTHLNLLNLLFVKMYDSAELYSKLAKERYIYYEVLDRCDRNLLDRGVIFKILNSSVWCRRWKNGHEAALDLSHEEISSVVRKLIEIHQLDVAMPLLKDLPRPTDVLSWFDGVAGSSLAVEWGNLRSRRSERSCVVHGDFQPKKHVIKLDRKLRIIDFGDAFIGSPSVDLGAIACSNPEIFEEVCSVYYTSVREPIPIEMINFWKRYFQMANTFWMNHKLKLS